MTFQMKLTLGRGLKWEAVGEGLLLLVFEP